MERSLTIINGQTEIEFSDLDIENDMVIHISSDFNTSAGYLNKENLISLRKHIDYLLDKLNSNGFPAEGN